MISRSVIVCAVLAASCAAYADLAGFVDPFVGTMATGHTTPAAAYPFGMVQAGPTTGTITWQYCSGYRYEDKAVTGYALTALSGTGFCEYNELQVLPFSGDVRKMPMTSVVDKATEKASPGWYAVKQPQDGVSVEIAAAKRAAIYRFAWEKGRRAKVLVNLPYGNGQRDGNQFAGSHDGKVTKPGDCRIEGEHFRTGCIMRRRIAFALEFSRPWTACEELSKSKPDELPRYVLSFDLKEGEALLLKSAFSINSPDAARRNLVSSIPAWDFDGVRDRTRAAWNEVLSRSVCEGSGEQKRNWYTALYHLYFQPNDYSDAGEKPYYTTLSLWDTFRACHPWYSIVVPEVNAGAVDSFMRLYKTFGRLPVMSSGGMNFDCMIGNHSVPVIVDAFLKEVQVGSRSCTKDVKNSAVGLPPTPTTKYWESVYAAIKNTLTQAHPGKPKENWDVYDKYGYFPYDRIDGEGVSRTFECAYDDWCAAQMAKGLGKAEDYKFLMKRAGYWKNVFDSSVGFARGKSSDGKWREPFDPFAFGHGAGRDNDFTEGNAFQYSWHVMHDVDGLVTAMGGREAALKKLEALFTADAIAAGAPPDVTGLIGQYVHGNEPSHHVIYLFSLLGRPDLTAKYVREVFDKFYLPKPDGLCGNDDCGQMSAWYLFSAMGFYPLNPCGGEYVIGAPQVPRVEIEVERRDGGGRRTFRVLARGLSKENKYVKSVMLNGRTIKDWKIRHEDIIKGGELVFEMVSAVVNPTDFGQFVNPFVGTDGPGHTYPAAACPFGMVQAGPDTGFGDWEHCNGYIYGDKTICGFTQTHLNGTGCPDLGDVRLMPLPGRRGRSPRSTDCVVEFDKESERAEPGYYAVTLPDPAVRVEIAAAEHSAIYRFVPEETDTLRLAVEPKALFYNPPEFPKRPNQTLAFDVVRDEKKGVIGLSGAYRTTCWVTRDVGYRVEFDRAGWCDGENTYAFDLKTGEPLVVKVGLSSRSADGARRNLAAEIPGWDFDAVKNAARRKWNVVLGRAVIEGTDEQKKNWYTSLYHLCVQPNNIADVGEKPFYSTFSCWDTFRAAGPLYTILYPEKAVEFVTSMLEQGKKTGYLPIWTLWGEDNQCMIGTHSVPMIVDAWLKGVWPASACRGDRDGTVESAYQQIKETLTKKHEGRIKENWDFYDKCGYYPFDKIRGESVSRTMECAYDDWCAGVMAEKLGHKEDAAFFFARSAYWKNVFDPSLGMVRGKDTKGKWREPFDPYALGHGADLANDFTEGNAFQYSWHVMQDVPGLVAAMGGKEKFVEKLDALFKAPPKTEGVGCLVDITGLIGQYVHGNEPSHHVIYFYPQVGHPEKAAERIREVFDKFYLPKPDGLCGNDDCGQMSAWYLFSAMGFYPFNPCGGEYIIGAPQIEKVTLRCSPSPSTFTSFTVIAKGLSKDCKYVKSVTLNGKPITDWKIRHADVVKGGELVFEMGNGDQSP